MENLWTVPNILTSYRLIAVPVIVWTMVAGLRTTFAVLIVINLVTDILDGMFARLLKQETALGAKLDSFADLLTFSLAVTGLVRFEGSYLSTHYVSFALLIGCYLVPQTWNVIRFGRTLSMHLYSSKFAGYMQGFFFADYYFFGPHPWALYTMVAASVLNNIEESIVVSLLPEARSNVRGLYWVLRERKRRA